MLTALTCFTIYHTNAFIDDLVQLLCKKVHGPANTITIPVVEEPRKFALGLLVDGSIPTECIPVLMDWMRSEPTKEVALHFLHILFELRKYRCLIRSAFIHTQGFLPIWIGAGLAIELFACAEGFHPDYDVDSPHNEGWVQAALTVFKSYEKHLPSIHKTIDQWRSSVNIVGPVKRENI